MATFEDLVSYPGNIIRVGTVNSIHSLGNTTTPHCKYCKYCTGKHGYQWSCVGAGGVTYMAEDRMKGTECATFEDRLDKRNWTLDEILGLYGKENE